MTFLLLKKGGISHSMFLVMVFFLQNYVHYCILKKDRTLFLSKKYDIHQRTCIY